MYVCMSMCVRVCMYDVRLSEDGFEPVRLTHVESYELTDGM